METAQNPAVNKDRNEIKLPVNHGRDEFGVRGAASSSSLVKRKSSGTQGNLQFSLSCLNIKLSQGQKSHFSLAQGCDLLVPSLFCPAQGTKAPHFSSKSLLQSPAQPQQQLCLLEVWGHQEFNFLLCRKERNLEYFGLTVSHVKQFHSAPRVV